MFTRWTSHLKTDEEKEKFKNEIKSARNVLERLRDIIKDDQDGLDRSEIHPKTYEQPNWHFHQAHKNGMRQYMHQIKTLIDLDQQKGLNNE